MRRRHRPGLAVGRPPSKPRVAIVNQVPANERTLRIGGAALGWPDGGLRVKDVSAEAVLALQKSRFVVERARLTAGASSLELAGGENLGNWKKRGPDRAPKRADRRDLLAYCPPDRRRATR